MAKREMKKRGVKYTASEKIPLTKTNYILFGCGVLALVLGYIAMLQPPWDNFVSRTLAPIIVVIGYCVIIPLSILYNKKRNTQE